MQFCVLLTTMQFAKIYSVFILYIGQGNCPLPGDIVFFGPGVAQRSKPCYNMKADNSGDEQPIPVICCYQNVNSSMRNAQ